MENGGCISFSLFAERLYRRCAVRREELPSFCLDWDLKALGMFRTGWNMLWGCSDCVSGGEIVCGWCLG